MNNSEREARIELWFKMWLKKRDLGIGDIFASDAVYTESWGPEYCGVDKIKLWFNEWNARGTVLAWDIKAFTHGADKTIVEWYFANRMNDGREERFEGVSVVVWSEEGKILSLKEFGCNIVRYDPYAESSVPKFRNDKISWF